MKKLNLVLILLFLLSGCSGLPVSIPFLGTAGPTQTPMPLHTATPFSLGPTNTPDLFVLNTLIGVVSPPIGLNMFIACALARCSAGEFTREAIPFLSALVLLLFTVTYIPGLTLWLPENLRR